MNRKDVITSPVNRTLVALAFKTTRVAGRSSGCSLRRTASVFVVATFGASFLNHACAAPGLLDPIVKQGSASIHLNQPSDMLIRQTSNKTVIDWSGFSLANGERLEFAQPGLATITLNRVTGHQASVLNGQIVANGQVWLLNPNGVLIGKTGRISSHGFLATTMGISDDQFLQGHYQFQTHGNLLGSVLNEGSVISSIGVTG
jgi:filamentous hemagglutinin family protein